VYEQYVIHVTRECNMACKYCYETDKTTVYTWEDVRGFIDNMLEAAPAGFQVEFLGGEPMLRWDLIQKSYEYIEEYCYTNPVKFCDSYSITTNGTILPQEALDYISSNKKILWYASMDGTIFANQLRLMKKGGKNSHDIVMENIQRVRDAGIEPHVHIVTHPYNVGSIWESIEHLYKHGVRHIGVGTVEKTIVIDDAYCKRFLEEMNKVSISVLSGEFRGLEIGLFKGVKPKSDVRCYIRDKDGKLLGESYGRVESDVTENEEYDVMRCDDPDRISHFIYHIREQAYEGHQRNMRKFNV